MNAITKETRRESYEAVLPKCKERSRLILEVLGSRSMTVSEITDELVAAGRIPYFNRNYVAPRISELKDMGVLKTAGRRKSTRSDATEAVWQRVKEQEEARSMSNTGTCRSCGKPILWIKTKAGKAMPCDPRPINYQIKPGASTKLVTPGGDVVSCEPVQDPAEAHGWGYTPHWSTCDNPNKFKRPRHE